MANNAARLAEINAILQAGARSVVTEGVSVTYDLEALRAERRTLMQEDEDEQQRRPIASSIHLGGF